MAYQDDIALMAHLMRRAGFGARRDTATGRCLYAPALSPGGIASRWATSHGKRQLHVSPREHEAPVGRESSLVLAPCVRHRQLEGGQLRSAAAADQSVP